MHRFIIPNFSTGKVWQIADKNIMRQWSQVLKFKPGEKIVLSDGRGSETAAVILAMNTNCAQVRVEKVFIHKPTEHKVCLCCALLKKENFEWVVQKAAEIGVNEIVPLITDRTVKAGVNQKRLEQIAKEASEQSHRAFLPTIFEPQKFAIALKNAKQSGDVLFANYGGEKTVRLENKNSVYVFIGPEGGWSEKEIQYASVQNARFLGLGSTILRAETAAVVASFLAINHFYEPANC